MITLLLRVCREREIVGWTGFCYVMVQGPLKIARRQRRICTVGTVEEVTRSGVVNIHSSLPLVKGLSSDAGS